MITSKTSTNSRHGKKRHHFATSLLLVILASALIVGSGSAAETDRSVKRNTTDNVKRTALVIGNSAYSKNPLKNPLRDAVAIAEQLRQSGFEVILTTDADRKGMDRAIKDFGTKLKRGGAGLFYFAGHGMQIDGRNYLLPVDVSIESESDVEYEAIDAGRVLGKMEDAGNGLNIVILDACRDNPFSRGFRSSGMSGLAKMDAPTGSFIAYATKPGSVAADGQSGHSPYTNALLSAMRQPGLKIEQLFKIVRNQVMQATDNKQVLWEASSLRGDFYFSPGEGSPVAVPAGVASQPLSPPTARQSFSINAEEEFWLTVKESDQVPELETYLQEYPQGRFAKLASLKINRLRQTPDSAATPEATAAEGEYTDPTTGMEFISVPAGCFQMGSPAGEEKRGDDEGPVHEVCVDGFYLGKYEVTNDQYRKFQPAHDSKDYEGRSLNGGSQPVVSVSWDDARAYAAWLSSKSGKTYRLPTEAEWEYAARGGTASARPWGHSPDGACGYANVHDLTSKRINTKFTHEHHNCDDGHAVTSPVGSFKPNNFGLHDMLGNVWEWCSDWYGKDYYGSSPRQNPTGPSSGDLRVLRGGDWNSNPGGVRSAYRLGYSPDGRYNLLGFRLILQASAPGR